MPTGIREVCDLEAKIKWPNDIVVNGKKVCGILTEMSTELECINYIVTGIGINVANHEFPEEIRDVATSLYLETGKEVRRSQLIAAIMRAYEGYYDKFMENQNMKSLMDVYNSRLANCGTQVRVRLRAMSIRAWRSELMRWANCWSAQKTERCAR